MTQSSDYIQDVNPNALTYELYALEIEHPLRGWIRVGHLYRDVTTARSWLPLVRGHWRCCARVRWVACLLLGGKR
jgi:hypothetical protein